jgi:hypothetical protein
VLLMLFSSGLSGAQDTVPRNKLVLPDLIQEALARNPELVAARKQWEAATNRIAQARSLDDPILSVQLWNIPQPFKATQADNTIFGLSQSLPFPGKLRSKAAVAVVRPNDRRWSCEERNWCPPEAGLICFAQKAVRFIMSRWTCSEFVAITNAKFRGVRSAQAQPNRAIPAASASSRPGQRGKTAEAMLIAAWRLACPWTWREALNTIRNPRSSTRLALNGRPGSRLEQMCSGRAVRAGA